jgi:hypothetical protein
VRSAVRRASRRSRPISSPSRRCSRIRPIHALERAVDLADQLAIAVAGAQFQRVLGFAGGALGFVADIAHFVLEVLDGLLGLLDQVGTPRQQALAEILDLQRAHVFLVGPGR